METATITTPDGPMDVYEAVPDRLSSEDAPRGVIVLPEAFGVNSYVQGVAGQLAEEGYHAAAVDLYHRSGVGTIPYNAFDRMPALLEGLSDEGVLGDIDSAIAHLNGAGIETSRIGIVGFCIGGRLAYLGALRRDVGAAVSFYGAGIITPLRISPMFGALAGQAGSLRAPWLGLFGQQDNLIPAADIETLRGEMEANAEAAHEIVSYDGAGHGFHCHERPDAYRADAAEDGWRRMLAWLDQHLG